MVLYPSRIKKIRQQLDELRAESEWNSVDNLELELDCLLALEEDYWKTRSRADWLMEGDRNTTYF